MNKFIVQGGNKLEGTINVSGAKNVALKALVAACLTDEEVIIHNIPLLSDVRIMIEIIEELGGTVTIEDHTAKVRVREFRSNKISLDEAAQTRTASMFIAPLLARNGEAIIPNPGGCRIGARPIDRTVEGLKHMGAEIQYDSDDGFFHATTHGDNIGQRPIDRTIAGLSEMGAQIRHDDAERAYYASSEKNSHGNHLHATQYTFEKNTHTGTETMLIAATLAHGTTVLENAAAEPEVDELINLLNAMGAKISRTSPRVIAIEGVEKLHGAEVTILPDRNEIVTFAIAAIATQGDVVITGAKKEGLEEFIEKLEEAGGGYEIQDSGIRFFYKGQLRAVAVETQPYPAFMTDWQAPWAVLMTQAEGASTIHETVFESRFGYVKELRKMGAKITYFSPEINDPMSFYNFNYSDKKISQHHAIKIHGPSNLHNGVVNITDLRAGATLVIAALVANGESSIHGIHYIERGYESFEKRLQHLGARIEVLTDENA